MCETYLTTLHSETDADAVVAGTIDETIAIEDIFGIMAEVLCVTADGSSERIDTTAEATAAQMVSLTKDISPFDDGVRE